MTLLFVQTCYADGDPYEAEVPDTLDLNKQDLQCMALDDKMG